MGLIVTSRTYSSVLNKVRDKTRSQLLRKDTITFMSVCPSAWNNPAPTGRIFMKFDIGLFFENLSRIVKFH